MEDEDHFWKAVAAQLAPWVVMFKHPLFREEQEWRLVAVNPSDAHMFRRSGRRIVPFTKLELADHAIERVVRGPYFRNVDKRGAALALITNGFVTAGHNLQDSQIPLIA